MKDGSQTDVEVAIIGSGFAGMGMAIRLQERGIDDVVLFERRPDVGGTWHDNRYPGAACDIPSHLYSLSFAPNREWSRTYSPQPEIWEYLRRVCDEHGLRDRIRFDTEIVRCEWDDEAARWHVTATDGSTTTSRILIHAVGPLKDPATPTFAGQDDFTGPRFHTARWDSDVDLRGRRVGIIGTGASAIQVAPAIADEVAHLTIFQRTAPWVVPRRDRAYTRLERFLYRWVPGLARANRAVTYLFKEVRYPLVFAGRELPVRIAERKLRRDLERRVPDPVLRQKVTPDFRLGCKRVLISSDWYPTVQRDDVTLETTPIERFTPDGIALTDGRHVDLDVVVYGTGFLADKPLGEMDVVGRNGVKLQDLWDPRPTAHLGITVPDFPNAFVLLGPNTGLGHNSVVIMIEAAIRYVLDAIQRLRADPDLLALDVRPEVHDAFVAEVDRRHANQAWASGCHSWYLNREGDNFSIWPGSTLEYLWRTRRFDADDYEHMHAPAAATPRLEAAPSPPA